MQVPVLRQISDFSANFVGILQPLTQVHITGKKTGRGKAHDEQNRRNSVEPIIGHLKNDGLLDRNYLRGREGDCIHAVLCGVGFNLKKILRRLREFLFALNLPLVYELIARMVLTFWPKRPDRLLLPA